MMRRTAIILALIAAAAWGALQERDIYPVSDRKYYRPISDPYIGFPISPAGSGSIMWWDGGAWVGTDVNEFKWDPNIMVVTDVNVTSLTADRFVVTDSNKTLDSFGAGTDGYIIQADSAEPYGALWADPNTGILSGIYMLKSLYDVLDDAFVDGNDTAYAASWNGNINAPSMNAVYDVVVGKQDQGDVLDDLNTLGAPASDGQFIVATGAGVFAYESTTTARTSLGVGEADTPTFGEVGVGQVVFSDTDQSPDAVGELLYDNTVTGILNGGLVWHDGATTRLIVDVNTLPSDDDYVVTYDADADEFYMAEGGAGGGDDEKVGVDADATADYIGAANSDGVLRTGTSLSYADGGDFVTLDAIQDIRTTSTTVTFASPFTITPVSFISEIRSNNANALMRFKTDRSSGTSDSFRWTQGNNTELMALTDNGRLDVLSNITSGATLAGTFLAINATAVQTATFINTSASGAGAGAGMIGRSADGAAMASGDRLGYFAFSGTYNAASAYNSAAMTCFTTEDWSDPNRGSEIQFETTPNNTAVRVKQLVIGQDGTADFQTNDVTTSGDVLLGAASTIAFSANLSLTGSEDTIYLRNSQTNERSVFRIMPNGTITPTAASIEFFGTDYVGDSTNWERLSFNGDTTDYEIFTNKGGTGTVRPLILYTSGNTNQFYLAADGTTGFGTASPTAVLHLKAGTATASTAPLKFTAGTALTTPETGAMEFNDGRFYITNVATQKAIDRTSDVAVSTVTVANTTVETTVWTALMPANSLSAGNVFKFHADGIVSNNSANAADEVTVRVKVGGVTVVTLNPNTKQLTNEMWHINANATQRTLGGAGARAVHIHLVIGDPISTGDETFMIGVAAIDTTANMDVTVTAQWATAHANNTLSLYQGFMEYKN